MGKVCNILQRKETPTISVSPDTTVFQGLKVMLDNNIGALLVMEGDKFVGIFTERDYARKIILQGKASRDTRIGEIMSEKLITVSPETTIEDCMRLMTNKYIRHLPVIENDKLIGIISIGDVVRYIIDEQKFIIENLEHYITGT